MNEKTAQKVEAVPYGHEADEHFVSLVAYLRHLVDRHQVQEYSRVVAQRA